MQAELICSENLEAILNKMLTSYGVSLVSHAKVCIVEKGQEIPDGKLCILFDMGSLNALMEFLSQMEKPVDTNINSIVGKLSEEHYELIPLPQICCFEGRGNFVYSITSAGEYRIKEKLYELEEKLPRSHFIRVSKSYIVNISNVKDIIPWFGGRLILRFNGCSKEVEVARSQAKSFKQFLGM